MAMLFIKFIIIKKLLLKYWNFAAMVLISFHNKVIFCFINAKNNLEWTTCGHVEKIIHITDLVFFFKHSQKLFILIILVISKTKESRGISPDEKKLFYVVGKWSDQFLKEDHARVKALTMEPSKHYGWLSLIIAMCHL